MPRLREHVVYRVLHRWPDSINIDSLSQSKYLSLFAASLVPFLLLYEFSLLIFLHLLCDLLLQLHFASGISKLHPRDSNFASQKQPGLSEASLCTVAYSSCHRQLRALLEGQIFLQMYAAFPPRSDEFVALTCHVYVSEPVQSLFLLALFLLSFWLCCFSQARSWHEAQVRKIMLILNPPRPIDDPFSAAAIEEQKGKQDAARDAFPSLSDTADKTPPELARDTKKYSLPRSEK